MNSGVLFYLRYLQFRRLRSSVLCAFLFTLELSTPLESGECVLSPYEIAFLDMVSLLRKEQNYFIPYAF